VIYAFLEHCFLETPEQYRVIKKVWDSLEEWTELGCYLGQRAIYHQK
jgi:hypothetical protein